MKAQSCDRMCEERLSDKSNDQRRNAALNDLSSAGYTADDADCVQTSVTGMKQRHTCRQYSASKKAEIVKALKRKGCNFEATLGHIIDKDKKKKIKKKNNNTNIDNNNE